MKRILLLVVIAVLALTACSSEPKVHEKLNGSWANAVMTVSFDFDKGTYSGVALGQQFTNKLSLVSEQGNAVVFKSNEDQMTAQFQDNGDVLITKSGGIPLLFSRVK